MLIYKYLSAERLDVLENLVIRFTQPLFLNDPYETNPIITGSTMTDEAWDKVSKIEAKRNGLNIKDFQNFERKTERDKVFPEMIQVIKTFFHHTTGILSLSETFDNPLMWAHYATNHMGYVIALDGLHPFLNSGTKEFTTGQLSKVKYSKIRPEGALENLTVEALYFTKSYHWEYENEWRIIKNIKDANIKVADGDVCLFSVPPECIKVIYLGASCLTETEEKILQYVEKHKLDVEVIKMVLNPHNYELGTLRLTDWLEYKNAIVENDIWPMLNEIKKNINLL
jgi:hypothetical protein